MGMRIAILGWGSLLWDVNHHPDFTKQHGDWEFDGPSLPLEFSRVSGGRNDALTLVIDEENGTLCQVAFAMSKRNNPDDAICDLRCREGTILSRIGYHFVDGSRNGQPKVPEAIRAWGKEMTLDVVIWTGLESNFSEKKTSEFSIEAAIDHLKHLPPEGKAKAFEYVSRAPAFITTKLRQALEVEPWFSAPQAASISDSTKISS
jgi:hypothetical protein